MQESREILNKLLKCSSSKWNKEINLENNNATKGINKQNSNEPLLN